MTKRGKNSKQNSSNQSSKKPRKPRRARAQQPRGYDSIGAQIGHGVQKLGESVFARIMGRGDYQLSENITSVAKNDLMVPFKNQPPTFSGGKSSFLFEHSEYVGDIIASSTPGAFNLSTWDINPANEALFPWLASLATSFESYEVEGMLFRYEATSGEAVASTNAALGTVMGYVAYDSIDPNVESKQTLLQYEGAVDARTSENFLLGVECDPSQRVMERLYVSDGVPSGADPRFYNLGKLVVATAGQQAASMVCGELWVHYKIRFYFTKTPLDNAIYGNVLGGYATYFGTDSSELFANKFAGSPSGPGYVSLLPTAPRTMIFGDLTKDAYYCINLFIKGSSATLNIAAPTLSNFTAQFMNGLGNGATILSNSGQTVDTYFLTMYVKANSETAGITFATMATPPGGSLTTTVRIVRVDRNDLV